MPSYPLLVRIARALPDDALVAALTGKQAECDEWAVVAGVNPETEADLRREVAIRDALRDEYRRRTGEVI